MAPARTPRRPASTGAVRAVVAVVAAVAVLGPAACSSGRADDSASATTETTAPASIPAAGDPVAASRPGGDGTLFVVEGTSGTAAPTADGWSLSMVVDADVLAFTDRPARGATRISGAELVERWASYGFADDPPNAALTATTPGDGHVDLAVEVSEPSWDADTEHLTVTARPIGDDAGTALPGAFDGARLFIDDATGQISVITDQQLGPGVDMGLEVTSIDGTEPLALGSETPIESPAVGDQWLTFQNDGPGYASSCTMIVASSDGGRWTLVVAWSADGTPSVTLTQVADSPTVQPQGLTGALGEAVPVPVDPSSWQARITWVMS